jgi:hypothetical protein
MNFRERKKKIVNIEKSVKVEIKTKEQPEFERW